MADMRVADYPDFRKRGAGVINTNMDEFFRATARRKNAQRLDKIENDLAGLNQKVDLLINLLLGENNAGLR